MQGKRIKLVPEKDVGERRVASPEPEVGALRTIDPDPPRAHMRLPIGSGAVDGLDLNWRPLVHTLKALNIGRHSARCICATRKSAFLITEIALIQDRGLKAPRPTSTSTLASCPSGSKAVPVTRIQLPLARASSVSSGARFGGGEPTETG